MLIKKAPLTVTEAVRIVSPMDFWREQQVRAKLKAEGLDPTQNMAGTANLAVLIGYHTED